MANFVLIWVLIGTISNAGMNYTIATGSQEFNLKRNCDEAKAEILKWKGPGIDEVKAVCLSKFR